MKRDRKCGRNRVGEYASQGQGWGVTSAADALKIKVSVCGAQALLTELYEQLNICAFEK